LTSGPSAPGVGGSGRRLRIATRRSPLALWQAEHVAARLREATGVETELVSLDTSGDRRQDRPVWEIGGQGVFVKEVQAALADGRADLAVHSAKDLPSRTADGLALAAVPVRDDPRDVLVGRALADLGPGATVATGSVRRRAQLSWWRPDLTFAGLRGNISTRLSRVPPGGVIVMAAAALNRLGIEGVVTDVLDPGVVLPQVGQGAVAVECRNSDDEVIGLLAAIDDPVAHAEVTAERAYLARLGGGCDLPVGALARTATDGSLRLEAVLASLDGRVVLRAVVEGAPAEGPAMGAGLAEELLAAGGAALLEDSGRS
jgi:hydroxymethylbilane synthase